MAVRQMWEKHGFTALTDVIAGMAVLADLVIRDVANRVLLIGVAEENN